MPAHKKLEGEKLDFQVTFTLQRTMGDAFQRQCGNEDVTIQEKLRYLVHMYIEWAREQEMERLQKEALSPSCPLTEVQSR